MPAADICPVPLHQVQSVEPVPEQAAHWSADFLAQSGVVNEAKALALISAEAASVMIMAAAIFLIFILGSPFRRCMVIGCF